MNTLILLIIIPSWCYAQENDLPKVLTPIVGSGEEVALLLVPGAYINALMYEPLGLALQKATDLQLWVGLVGPFPRDLPNQVKCAEDINSTLNMMREMGMNSTILFLAGHSLGGVVMQSWASENVEEITGIILMASELGGDGLTSAEFPVMHISGDLDGLETVAKTAFVYDELRKLVSSDSVNNKITSPVTILQDVNHMHFASGEPTTTVEEYDILSPISQDEAQTLIAKHMIAFVTAISELPAEDIQSSEELLIQDYDDTGYIMKPYFENFYLTDTISFSEWSQIGQIIISSIVENASSLVVNDTILPFDDIVNAKPSLVVIDETAYTNTYTAISYPLNINLNNEISAVEMAVKFKSREAIMEAMEPFGNTFGGNTSCRLVNEEALNVVLTTATEVQLSRYENRSKRIIFTDDAIKQTGEGWVDSEVTYNETEADLIVTSPALHTEPDAIFDLGGMHYCKLMPPARMIEYITIFGLRGTNP